MKTKRSTPTSFQKPAVLTPADFSAAEDALMAIKIPHLGGRDILKGVLSPGFPAMQHFSLWITVTPWHRLVNGDDDLTERLKGRIVIQSGVTFHWGVVTSPGEAAWKWWIRNKIPQRDLKESSCSRAVILWCWAFQSKCSWFIDLCVRVACRAWWNILANLSNQEVTGRIWKWLILKMKCHWNLAFNPSNLSVSNPGWCNWEIRHAAVLRFSALFEKIDGQTWQEIFIWNYLNQDGNKIVWKNG